MQRSSARALLFAGVLVGFAAPAGAQLYDPNYDALSHSDGISLSGGNASRANTAIQTPTPWPRYLNDFDFDMPGQQGVDIMTNYLNKYAAPAASTAGTTINITQTK